MQKKITPKASDGEIGRRLEQLAEARNLPGNQENILVDTILDLAGDIGVCFTHPKIIRAFWEVLREHQGSDELIELLRLIDAGETFDDYEGTERLAGWKKRQSLKRPTARTKKKVVKVTINRTYNADDIKAGEILTVEAGAEFTDGDLVVIKDTDDGALSAVFIYHTTRRNAHRRRYKYLTRKWKGSRNYQLFYGDEFSIIGRVVGRENAPEEGREDGEIERLQARLRRLRDEGDITNETAIFELERKIHNLENKLDEDEWPDVIGGEGE